MAGRVTGAAAVAAALAIVAALAYGYWFSRTHGSLYVSMTDVSNPERPREVRPVTLSLLDSHGSVLAEMAGTEESVAVFLSSPATYACRELERQAPFDAAARDAWSECFERQSRWVPTWVRRVAFADLRADGCVVRRLPVTVEEYQDAWWLWWVPVAHVGGKPYTSFSITVAFDRGACEPAATADLKVRLYLPRGLTGESRIHRQWPSPRMTGRV